MNARFETTYPLNARTKEIKAILTFVTKGQSCQLISVPGAGRSTILRLLAYNEKLREHHLNQELGIRNHERKNPNSSFITHNSYLFIYVNFAEIPSFDTPALYKSLFLAILSSIRDQGEGKEPWTTLGKEIYGIFKEAISLNDPLVLLESLKKALQLCTHAAIVPIFLFDRFSEFAEKIAIDFFAGLKALRIVSGGKLAIVFSTHRPLEELLSQNHWGDFYEFFVGNHIYVDMYDEVATSFRIEVLEKEYAKQLEPKVKKELVTLTGGHGKLMKLSTQILLATPRHPELVSGSRQEMPKQVRHDNVINTLLEHILIRGSLLEIWGTLTPDERRNLKDYIFNNTAIQQFNNSLLTNLHLPFPLLVEFIKRNIPDTMVPKTIRLDQNSNEIYFGDDPIEGLTAYEFKLLKFLIQNPGRVCERDEIINATWSDTKSQEGVSDEALDQMIYRLRKKIEDEADNPKHLLTVKGRGFRFIP